MPAPTYRVRWIRRDGSVLYMAVIGDPRLQVEFWFTRDLSAAHHFLHRSAAQDRVLDYARRNQIPMSEFEIQQN